MISPILSRRKWMLKAHDQHIVIVRGTRERFTHPLMKALLWALYIPNYPNISVEIHIGDKYKPDVIAYPPGVNLRSGEPVFWGEAGQTGRDKIRSLVRRYRNTHFALAKYDTTLDPHIRIVRDALDGVTRHAPFDLISFPEDSAERFFDAEGNVTVTFDELHWVRLE
ncbi:MAG: hypothetical protein K8L99_23755 [Anaerolineae bacterium]|nr:hypothetical protein [Anaerolineae bacterium]